MSALHEALTNLRPAEWSDVPLHDLPSYLQKHLEAAELIANSVPPPPDGEPFHSSSPAKTEPDTASSAKEIHVSAARPADPHDSHQDLRKSWGKPLKVSAKDNPLDVKVYKMAAHDKYGAWFARSSVHEGISFSRMKKAMKWEFMHSLATEGGPGAGAVRGIGVDQRLEKHNVGKDSDLMVYQLSAQFPGPVSPREFITMIMTSDNALTVKSSFDGTRVPRHFIILSKPVTHPDAAERSGYIRGFYESIEMIREVPLHKRATKAASTSNLLEEDTDTKHTRDRGSTISFAESRGPDAKGEQMDKHTDGDAGEEELNPIEWVMVTRSDPGGGIPRFMVERGTPASITADVAKFFDWACSQETIPDPDVESEEEMVEKRKSEAVAEVDGPQPDAVNKQDTDGPNGLLSGAREMVQSGIEAYAPAAVTDYLKAGEGVDDREDSDSDSSTSYESADDYMNEPVLSAESLPLSDTVPSIGSETSVAQVTGFAHHDKELQKLEHSRKKLEEKLVKRREAESAKVESQKGKNEQDQAKAREKQEKEMKKHEERHAKEMAKLDDKKEREMEKARRKRKKQQDKDMISKVTRERDDFRSRIELIQKENALLRDQIGEVQRENSALVRRLSKLAGGDVAMQAIKDELGKKGGRPGSTRSVSSSVMPQS